MNKIVPKVNWTQDFNWRFHVTISGCFFSAN